LLTPTRAPYATVDYEQKLDTHPGGRCRSCGCKYDDLTIGCKTCKNRHNMRAYYIRSGKMSPSSRAYTRVRARVGY
jgi:hypothetical protein